MSLLSRFKARRAPESHGNHSRAAAELFRRSAIKVFPLSGEDFAVYVNSQQQPVVLPGFVTDFLLACAEFRQLAEHLGTYANFHGLNAEDTGALQDWIPQLQRLGLLVSANELRAGMRERSRTGVPDGTRQITAIGFPTGDRVALLRRSIESFIANARTHGRAPAFVVADNSTSPDTQAECRQMLRAVAHENEARIEYAGDEEKRRFARALSERSGVDRSLVDFALFGAGDAGRGAGANRNALLLHQAGTVFCTADDDSICHVAAAPELRERLALFAGHDAFERHFFANKEAAFGAARFVEKDYCALHEALLGKAVGACVTAAGNDVQFDAVTDEFLDRLAGNQGDEARVLVTFAGCLGDPGLISSYYWMHCEGGSFRRLTKSRESYHAALRSRAVHMSVASLSIGDASLSPGLSIGQDARAVLPPFLPVTHCEDWPFGATVWKCCPASFLGHLPYALSHRPAAGRTVIAPGDLNAANRTLTWEFGHILYSMILGWRPRPAENTSETRLRGLGRHLREIAGADLGSFIECVQVQVLHDESRRIADLEARIEQDGDAPEYWRTDAREYVNLSRDALLSDAAFEVPWEFKQQGCDAESARRRMQSLVFHFGSLLEAWPDLFAAAKDLRERGEPLATQL